MHAMKSIGKELLSAMAMTAVLVVVLCGAYPLAIFVLAQGTFPFQANGSVLHSDGTPIGSKLLSQQFTAPQYFHPRPSEAGAGHDATASGGSNLGPISKELLDKVSERVVSYRHENGISDTIAVPTDAVTASASGLDPHISVENARLQMARVARARDWAPERVSSMIQDHTEGRTLGILGEPRVNVLQLNLALDTSVGNGK
jgi:K+-transporting ATPase ATPase C chain